MGKGYIATVIVCAAILLALCVLLWSTSFAAGRLAKSGHVFPAYISEAVEKPYLCTGAGVAKGSLV